MYYNAEDLDVYGVKHIDGIYRRMQYDDALAVSENVALISSECAGGRVRFATDSPYIALADNIHPNDVGFACMAKHIVGALKNMMG